VSLWVSLSCLLLMSFGPYAEDRTPFQFLARQMICVALPSHLSFGPYARGVHPLIFLSTPSTPPGTSVHHTENGFAFIPVEVRASIRHIYICRHVSGHVSTPGCVSRLGPERSTSSLTVLVLSQYLYYTVHRLDRIRLRAWSTRNQIWITMRTDMLW
jgi:hypothetical protein